MIVSQRITNNEIYIKFVNGNEFYKTKQDIQDAVALYGGTGSAAARKTRTIDGLRTELQAAMGDCGDANTITIDFGTDGTPTVLGAKKL